jgi:integrase/recombinase XerD
MTPLQQRMIEDMTVRGLVPSTQQAYLRAVRGLTSYYKRSPDDSVANFHLSRFAV